MVVGQADVSPNYEHLKAFDALIGTWVYDGPVLEDVPDFPGKGTPMAVHMTWRWLYNKAAIEYKWEAKIGALPKFEGISLDGWNAAEEEIVSRGVASTGSISSGIVSFSDDGKRLTVPVKTVEPDGAITSGTVVYVMKDQNTFVWKNIDRQGNDLPPNSPEYRFKRMKHPDSHGHDHDHDDHDHDSDEDNHDEDDD
jgi:hypothetical protein